MSGDKIVLVVKRVIPHTTIYREADRAELTSLESLVPTLSSWNLEPTDRIYVKDSTGLCPTCRVKKILKHMLNIDEVEVLEWIN